MCATRKVCQERQPRECAARRQAQARLLAQHVNDNHHHSARELVQSEHEEEPLKGPHVHQHLTVVLMGISTDLFEHARGQCIGLAIVLAEPPLHEMRRLGVIHVPAQPYGHVRKAVEGDCTQDE